LRYCAATCLQPKGCSALVQTSSAIVRMRRPIATMPQNQGDGEAACLKYMPDAVFCACDRVRSRDDFFNRFGWYDADHALRFLRWVRYIVPSRFMSMTSPMRQTGGDGARPRGYLRLGDPSRELSRLKWQRNAGCGKRRVWYRLPTFVARMNRLCLDVLQW